MFTFTEFLYWNLRAMIIRELDGKAQRMRANEVTVAQC